MSVIRACSKLLLQIFTSCHCLYLPSSNTMTTTSRQGLLKNLKMKFETIPPFVQELVTVSSHPALVGTARKGIYAIVPGCTQLKLYMSCFSITPFSSIRSRISTIGRQRFSSWTAHSLVPVSRGSRACQRIPKAPLPTVSAPATFVECGSSRPC